MDTIYTIIIIISIVFLALITVWIIIERAHKIRIRIRQVVQGTQKIIDRKAREVIDGDNVLWWRIAGEKKLLRNVQAPEERCINIDSKGRKHAEMYRLESGDHVWIHAEANTGIEMPIDFLNDEKIPLDIMALSDAHTKELAIKEWKQRSVEKWQKEHGVVKSFQPITTKQRVIYLNNMRKAEQRKGMDWKMQLIPIVSIGAISLVLICLMVFWGDIAKPALEAGDKVVEMQRLQTEQIKIIKEIEAKVQSIPQDSPKPPQNPPN